MYRGISIFYFLTSCLYIATINFRPYPGDFLIKIIPILLLIYVATKQLHKVKFILPALIFSSIGDVILSFDKENLFVFGLGAFLIAHLFYVFSFRPLIKRLAGGWIRALTITIFALGLIGWLSPALLSKSPDLVIPVYIYVAVITTMGICAAYVHPVVFVGAFIFACSDGVIAINKFQVPFAAAPYVIMLTYYVAQYLIIRGIMLRLKILSA